MAQFLWKIGGEAGFGIMTVGLSFSKIASRSGYEIFDYNEYPSLIRGGHNTYEVNISDEPVQASKQLIDLLICLNKETYTQHKSRLGPESVVVYDSDDFEIEDQIKKVNVPFKKIKQSHEVMQIMINTVAIGASIALLDGDLKIFQEIIEQEFMRKGQAVVDFNIKFASIGYDHVKANFSTYIRPILKRKISDEKIVATGNDIFSLGAVAADCRFYAAYPMTPSSTVLTTLAAWQVESGMVVRHSEDEIAVVSTALGASFGGVRSAVGTSGGGYALMTESVSYAGVAELPLVLFMSMRPGPATGMPTWTDQGDILFVVNGGHGEFPKIVLVPGDIHEMFELTLKAFDLADIYQLPVLLVSDKYLSESHQSYSKKAFENRLKEYVPNRGKTISTAPENGYLRYKLTDDGISDRLIPGAKGHFYQANSYEHVEDGHTTESATERLHQVHKRAKKLEVYLKDHFKAPEVFGTADESEICFISWGSNKGPILEARKLLAAEGKKTMFVHFTHLYPMDPVAVRAAIPENKRYILIEANSHAQFGKLLRMETGIHIEEKLLKYDGRPFLPEEIVSYIKK